MPKKLAGSLWRVKVVDIPALPDSLSLEALRPLDRNDQYSLHLHMEDQ